MDAHIVSEASKTIALPNNEIDSAGIIAHPDISNLLYGAIVALACYIRPQICSSLST